MADENVVKGAVLIALFASVTVMVGLLARQPNNTTAAALLDLDAKVQERDKLRQQLKTTLAETAALEDKAGGLQAVIDRAKAGAALDAGPTVQRLHIRPNPSDSWMTWSKSDAALGHRTVMRLSADGTLSTGPDVCTLTSITVDGEITLACPQLADVVIDSARQQLEAAALMCGKAVP